MILETYPQMRPVFKKISCRQKDSIESLIAKLGNTRPKLIFKTTKTVEAVTEIPRVLRLKLEDTGRRDNLQGPQKRGNLINLISGDIHRSILSNPVFHEEWNQHPDNVEFLENTPVKFGLPNIAFRVDILYKDSAYMKSFKLKKSLPGVRKDRRDRLISKSLEILKRGGSSIKQPMPNTSFGCNSIIGPSDKRPSAVTRDEGSASFCVSKPKCFKRRRSRSGLHSNINELTITNLLTSFN